VPGGRLAVLVVYGTRPEAIKLAPVIAALRARPERFAVRVCTTGQHREMLEQVQELFGLRPDVDLRLMSPDQSLNGLTAAAVLALDAVLAAEPPDWVLVQGDTTTAMATALAAFHRRLAVGHVEAGLRTGDLASPFPEEANRRVVDLLGSALFAPTPRAREALLAEGADPSRVHVVGNTGIDALRDVAAGLAREPEARQVLVTLHRRESFGAPLAGILGALRRLAGELPDVAWIYPVHPNPNVRGPAHAALGDQPNVRLCEPLGYRDLVRELLRCQLVLTDSGGIQEEAPALGKPVLVLRGATERPEGVAAGTALLIGTAPERIHAETARLLGDRAARERMARAVNPYGDGLAAPRIAAILAGEPWSPFAPDRAG
jgi:UDP-N-acetylglucosamine 2-epimerase (non-hydrolysing)